MKIGYIACYRDTKYIRNNTISAALKEIENVELYICKNKHAGIFRYIEVIAKLALLRLKKNPDLYILGFRGHEIFFPVKILTLGRPLWFDAMMSPFNSVKDEKKYGKLTSIIISPLLYWAEKLILTTSTRILTDTTAHTNYFVDTFGIERNKIFSIPVGAIEGKAPTPKIDLNPTEEKTLNVLFYGSMLPLHGINHFLDAIKKLGNLNIHFTIVGNNKKYNKTIAEIFDQNSSATINHIHRVSYSDLIFNYIPAADLGIGGPFGLTSQSKKVVTGKTQQFLAFGIPVLVGMPAFDAGFSNKKNSLCVPQGSSDAIKESILWAYSNRELLREVGTRGYNLYNERYSVEKARNSLKKVLFNA